MGHTLHDFPERAARALGDQQLQSALITAMAGLTAKRSVARDGLPEFDALRDQSRDIKDHVLEYLDIYLERYEAKVQIGRAHV